MVATVGVNGLSVVHKDSEGVTVAFPDVCKTPTSSGTPPIPYSNTARSQDADQGSKSVKCDGHSICLSDSVLAVSTGDEAGSAQGVASGTIRGKAEFVNYSFDVRIEGKAVPRALDPMLHNDRNSVPAPLLQPLLAQTSETE